MSKNANATGSRASTHLEKLVLADPHFTKKEFQKPRHIRLEQARQPPKYIPEDVRNKVRKEKTKQFCSLEKRSERELKKWQDRKLVAPQQRYQKYLKDYIQATIEKQPNEVVESQKKGHDHVSQQRGERTNRGLQKQKQQLQISKSTSFLRKNHVHEVEKARSAHVINLNKKKNNSAFKKKKRKGVLSATVCPSRLCKRSASESEIKELLEFCSSSCSSKNGTFKSASTEKDLSEKLKYVRGDYNRLSENANVAPPPKQEHGREVFITNYVDTQTSARIKRRTFKGDFNEPIRNICDNIIRDVNTKKKTRNEGPLKSYNRKHFEPDHLNKKRISNSEQPMPDFIKNGDGKSPTKPPECSRTSPASAIPIKCSKGVTSTTSNAKRVQCYDHKNRYFKEYVPNNANVEKTNIDRNDKVRAYTDESKLVERMWKRDSAELRENKTPKKIKVQRNYDELMQQLPILKNRIASIPIHKTTYHMSENKPNELQQKRQKRMENVYESLSPKRQVITTPSKRQSASTSNNLPFRAFNIRRTSPVLDFKTKEKKIPNILHKNIDSNLTREAEEKVVEIPANADVPSQRGENLQKLLTSIPVDIHHHQLFDRFDNIDAFIYVGDTATKKSSTSNQQQRSRFRHETNTTIESQNVKASSSSFSPFYKISKSANNFANEIPSLQGPERRGSNYHTSFAGSHSTKFCMRRGCAEHHKHACEIVIKVNEKGEPEICLSPIKLKDVREAVSIPKLSLKMPNVEMSKKKKKATSTLAKLDKPKLVDEQKTKAIEVSKVEKPKKHTSSERSALLWRDLFSQNYSNSRTSYYGPPTTARAQGHSAASMQKVKTDFDGFFLKKPRQGNLPNAHLCCCSGDATKTLTSYLDQHNKRLPMMSRRSFDQLVVSSDSDVPDDSHIYHNTPKNSNSFKRNAQIQSPGDARKMALEEYTEENYPGILLAYNKLAENFAKKIENLAIIEKVKQDKLSMLQSHTMLTDNKKLTKYMTLPTKFKQQKSSGERKTSHSDTERQELDRQLLENDYSFAEQLEKIAAADAAEEREDTINVKLLQRYKNLLERHTANDQVNNKQQKEYVRSTKQGLQPTTLEVVGDNSASELENIESVLKRMGMGWAVATLRKTQESLALTSSSSNSVSVGTKQKAINQTDSNSVSVRNKKRRDIIAKLSSSSAKTHDSSTFPPFSNEFQNTSAIQNSSVSTEKALLRASTPTQTSRLTNGRSKNNTHPRTTITAEPGTSSANYSYANDDGTRFYSLKEQSPIERRPTSSNNVEFQNMSAIRGSPTSQRKVSLQTSTPIQSDYSSDDRSRNDTQPRYTTTGKDSPIRQDEVTLRTYTPIQSNYSTDDKRTSDTQPRYITTHQGSPIRQDEATLRTYTPIQSSYSTDHRRRSDIQPRYIAKHQGSPVRQDKATLRTYTPIQSSCSTDDRTRSDTQPRYITTGQSSPIHQDETTLRIYTPTQSSYPTDDRRDSDTQPRYITTGNSSPIRQEEATLRPYTPIKSSYSTDDRRKNDTQPRYITTRQGSPIYQEEATLRTYTPIQSSYSTNERMNSDTQPRYNTTGKILPIRQEEATLRPYTPLQSSYSTDDRRKSDVQPYYITTRQGSPIRQDKATLRTYTPIQSSYSTDDRRSSDTHPPYITTGKSSPIRQDKATLQPYTPIKSTYSTDDRRESETQPRYIMTRQCSPISQDEATLRTYTPIQSSYSTDDRKSSDNQHRFITTGKSSPIHQDEATLRPYTPIESSYSTDDRRKSDTPSHYTTIRQGSPIRQDETTLRTYTPIQSNYSTDDRKSDAQSRYITRQGSPLRQDEAILRPYTLTQSSYSTDNRRKSDTQPYYNTTRQGSPIRQDEATLRAYTPIQSSYSTDEGRSSDTQPRYITTSKSSPIRQDEAILRPYTPTQSSYFTDDRRKSDTQPCYITTRQGSPLRQDEVTLQTYTPIQSRYSTNDRRRSGTQPRYITTGDGSAIRQVEGTFRSSTSIQNSYSIDDNSRNDTQPSYIITGEDSSIRQEETTLSTSTPIQNSYSIDDSSRNNTQPSYIITGEDSSIRQAETALSTSTPIQNSYSIDDNSRNDTQPSYIMTRQCSPISQQEATLRTSKPIQKTYSIDDRSRSDTQPRYIITGESSSIRQEEATLRTSTPLENTYSIDDRSKSDTQPRYIITGEDSSIRQEEDTLRTSTPIESSKSTDDSSGNISQPPITLAGEGLMMLQEDATLLTSARIQDSYSTEDRWGSDTQASIIITGEGLAIRQEETTLRTSTSIQSSNLDDDRWRNDTEPRYIRTGEDSPMREEEATLRTSALIGSSKSTLPRIAETAENSTMPEEGATLSTFIPIRSSKATDDLSRDTYLPRIAETAEDSTMTQEGATLWTFTPIRSSKASDDLSRDIYLSRITETGEDSTMRQAEATLWTVGSSKSTDQESKNISQLRITGTGTDSSIRQEEASLQTSTPIRNSKPTDNKSKIDTEPRITITGKSEVSPFYSLKKESSYTSVSTSESTTSEDLSMGQLKATLQTFTPIQSSKFPGGKSNDISQPRIPILGDSEISSEKYTYAKVEGLPLSSLNKQSPIKSGSSSGSTSESTSSTSTNVDFKNILTKQELSAFKEKDNLRTYTPIQRSKSSDNKSKNIYKGTVMDEDSPLRQEDAFLPTSTAIQSSKSSNDKSNNISQPSITMTGERRSMVQEEATLRTSTPIQSNKSPGGKSKDISQSRIPIPGDSEISSEKYAYAKVEDSALHSLKKQSSIKSGSSSGSASESISGSTSSTSSNVDFKDILAIQGLSACKEVDNLPTYTPTHRSKSTDNKSNNISKAHITVTGEDSSMRQEDATFPTSTAIQSSIACDDKSNNISQQLIRMTGEGRSMDQEEPTLETSAPKHSKLSELKSALVRMGKGCCPFGSIRRTRAALALTPGLRSYVDAGVEQKQINMIDSDSVSFKDALEREILDKLSSSSTTTDDSSTFSPFSKKFQNTSAIKGSSISQGKDSFWTPTPIEDSKSNTGISENNSQPRVTITGQSKVTSVKYSYANVDGALFYRIMEQLSITSETSSETTSGSTTSTSSSM